MGDKCERPSAGYSALALSSGSHLRKAFRPRVLLSSWSYCALKFRPASMSTKAFGRLLALLPVPGAALLVLGIVGDVQSWWERLSFLSNVLAGITTACFGVPIAYFVIQRLISKRQEVRAREATRALLAENLKLLEEAILDLAPFDAHRSTLRFLKSRSEQAANLLREAGSKLDGGEIRAWNFRNAKKTIEELQALTESYGSARASATWAEVLLRWRMIYNEVIPRAFVSNLAPIDPKDMRELAARIESTSGLDKPYGFRAMIRAAPVIRTLNWMEKVEMTELLPPEKIGNFTAVLSERYRIEAIPKGAYETSDRLKARLLELELPPLITAQQLTEAADNLTRFADFFDQYMTLRAVVRKAAAAALTPVIHGAAE
jgi:hypothetical protein